MIRNKLKTKFKNLCRPDFTIQDSYPCDECIERHDELIKGRAFTFDDFRCSCHRYMFYELDMFPYLLPILLRDFINSPKKWYYDSYLIDIFFEKMRRKELILHSFYSKEQKGIFLDTLSYLHDIYYMENFEVWDFDNEKMIHYHEKEDTYNTIHQTLIFWKSHMEQK